MDILKAETPQVTAATPSIRAEDAKDIDRAALFLEQTELLAPLSAKAEKRLKTKIDLILLPMASFNLRTV